MSTVRVIARIRPLLPHEIERDVIVEHDDNKVTIPNPRKQEETFTFNFNAVHGMECDQATLFTEVSPALKHAFKGNDVTIFAYGVTGTGKTHTMRGGKKAVDRGLIPRLLAALFRRKKELEKKSETTTVNINMSYYEIYNDKVYDLFEAPEKRSAAGLPLREFDKKTIVVGLSEKEVTSPAQFDQLYDLANNNRSTSATKLNAHSSRSHAVTCVKVTIEDSATGEVKEARISAIDLAGSEDNRRAGNDKERMLESQSINKSLFVLAQCVDAISKKALRIPYRDSKMTRILSLGQNNSMTIMILNLAPTKAYHQDTLSSLTVASRAKSIETREVAEDVETFKKPTAKPSTLPTAARVPLRALATTANKPPTGGTSNLKKPATVTKPRPTISSVRPTVSSVPASGKLNNLEAKLEEKLQKLESTHQKQLAELKAQLDSQMSETKVSQQKMIEKLEQSEVQREARMYCHLAKQDRHRGDFEGAIQNYRTALLYYPDHPKIMTRIENLEALVAGKAESNEPKQSKPKVKAKVESDPVAPVRAVSQAPGTPPPARNTKKHAKLAIFRDSASPDPSTRSVSVAPAFAPTPRTSALLNLLNAPSLPAISKLKGIGAKRAEKLYTVLTDENGSPNLRTLEDIIALPGLGAKIVETMRTGMTISTVGGGVGEGKENVDPLPELGSGLEKKGGLALKPKKAALGTAVKKPLMPATLFDMDINSPKKRARKAGEKKFKAKWCFQDDGEESEYVASEVEADASYCDSEEEGKRRKRRAGGISGGRVGVSVR